MNVSIRFFQAGSCRHPEFTLIQGGNLKSIEIPAIFALIEHPQAGNILFDTGYTQRFFSATQNFPASLYALVTPVTIEPHQTALAQLAAIDIPATAVQYIIYSHLHADHIGGLLDFPQAKFIGSDRGYQAVASQQGLARVMAGFLPELLPPDFLSRTEFTETMAEVDLPARFWPFDRGIDLWEDGTMWLVDLPGHAIGQLGLFLTDEAGITYFLIADACWLSRAYQELLMPSSLANLIMASASQYRETLGKIHRLHQQQPDIQIIPTHCDQVLRSIL
jgi:glyoxylase-like metal-dependent hydrolase (beta-lactamase superfamily II)